MRTNVSPYRLFVDVIPTPASLPQGVGAEPSLSRISTPLTRCTTRGRKISQFKHYPMDAPI